MENNKTDIRWIQRYNSFNNALKRFTDVVEHRKINELSDLEKEGLVQRFEYTSELSWKVLQDFLEYKGYTNIKGPNPVLRKSFEDGLIEDQDAWRRLITSRNITSHAYDESQVEEIVKHIYEEYAPLLIQLKQRFEKEKLDTENE
jgi:nucleotidyltransferase substrate binding protein (TIGR01987 family)